MSILTNNRIGNLIRCRVEKGEKVTVGLVPWHNAMEGVVVSKVKFVDSFAANGPKQFVNELDGPWTVVEVDV